MTKKLFVYFLSLLSFCLLSGYQLNDDVTTQLFKLTTAVI